MEAYYNYFNKDDIFKAEWDQYVEAHYKYDPRVMYYPMVMEDEKKAFKNGEYNYNGKPCEPTTFQIIMDGIYFGKNDDNSGQQIGRMLTPQEVNERSYRNWLYYRKKEFRNSYVNNTRVDTGLNYYWITLNFSPESDIEKVKFHTNRFVRLACFKGCKMTYCYEYYTTEGFHPHVHILCELSRTGTISLSTILRDAFKDTSLYEIMSDEQKIDVKFSKGKDKKRARPRSELNAYLSGNKIEKKQVHSNLDKFWRKKNKLDPLYRVNCV